MILLGETNKQDSGTYTMAKRCEIRTLNSAPTASLLNPSLLTDKFS